MAQVAQLVQPGRRMCAPLPCLLYVFLKWHRAMLCTLRSCLYVRFPNQPPSACSVVDLETLGEIPTVSWKKLTKQADGGREKEERKEKKEKREKEKEQLGNGAPKESGDEASGPLHMPVASCMRPAERVGSRLTPALFLVSTLCDSSGHRR